MFLLLSPEACPHPYECIHGQCYYFERRHSMTFDAANAHCIAMGGEWGGQLAEMSTQEDADALMAKAKQYGESIVNLFLNGLRDYM
jgi:hypothetical protein